MTQREVWMDVPAFGGHYQASSMGNIRSKDRYVTKMHSSGKTMRQFYPSKILKQYKADYLGHMSVHIGFDNKKITIAVHRLVLMAFSGMPTEGKEACHCNGIASDNRLENLRWDTHYNNNQDRRAHGNYANGQDHHMAKFSPEQIKGIRSGAITRAQAINDLGISSTQFHRIKTFKSWINTSATEAA